MLPVILSILFLTPILPVSKGSLSGPVLLWGPDILNSAEGPALGPPDLQKLQSTAQDVDKIILFEQPEFVRVNEKNYGKLSALMKGHGVLLQPQKKLQLDLNTQELLNKTEIIHLFGTIPERDTKIAETFGSLEEEFGKGRVLGIITVPEVEYSLVRSRREAEDPTSEPQTEDFVYNASGKCLLYTETPPILRIMSENKEGEAEKREMVEYELREHGLVTLDEREQRFRLIVTFNLEGLKIILRFRFPFTQSYWSLNSVEFSDSKNRDNLLTVVGEPPGAPIGFSYKCSAPLIFRNGSTTLTLNNVQVQPSLSGSNQFSEAYDCVGFTTAPIWSGMLVVGLMISALIVAITAILDIRTPNKFENSRSKQLAFTVSD